MITNDGRRLMNSVLANREDKIATHLALGINIVSDASLRGDAAPFTHNKYHSPYIVNEIPIANIGIIDGDPAAGVPDQIVYSGQAAADKTFIANNIALVARRSAGEIDEQTIIVPVNSTQWDEHIDDGSIPLPSTVRNFTEDGYLLLDPSFNAYRTYSDRVNLYGKSLGDIIAFPFTVHGIADPTGININLKFTHSDLNDIPIESELTRTIIAADPDGYMIEDDSPYNVVPQLGDPNDGNRMLPFVWQARIQEFSNSAFLLANGDRITKAELSVSGGTGLYQIAYGSIKFTPDNISNFYRITTGYRNLRRTLYKTNEQAYVNAEYRILGV